MKYLFLSFLLTSFVITGCSQHRSSTEKQVGGGCEDCDLMFAGIPANLSWKTKIASEDEPGEPMIISGVIYKNDGKTPAPGVILYIYHTDDKGLYSPAPKQTQARRHGHLRGWMKTDEQGRYEFKTIRPASYPNSRNAQHIHPIIKEPGLSYYWIDDYLFEDDPLLSDGDKAMQREHGGPGIIKLVKTPEGVWKGKRDITLGLNIPGY
ncbi:MAG: intradiol ring-cleavage dioxygenase [Cyclobacteriaceae bacterium]|nr:intradiol ring-cleavage dioxygenase [Cyclobacteriaceae bacterium]